MRRGHRKGPDARHRSNRSNRSERRKAATYARAKINGSRDHERAWHCPGVPALPMRHKASRKSRKIYEARPVEAIMLQNT